MEADPKQAVLLHMVDGTVKEEGSTKLLHDVVRELRTEQALDGSLSVKVLAELRKPSPPPPETPSPIRSTNSSTPWNGRRWRKRRRQNPEGHLHRHPQHRRAEEAEEHVPVFFDARRISPG